MYMSMQVCVYVCMYVYIGSCACIYLYVGNSFFVIYMSVYASAYMFMCMCVHADVYV